MSKEDFDKRADEFVKGLDELMRRTGIAIYVSESLACDGDIAMDDSKEDGFPRLRRHGEHGEKLLRIEYQ